TGRSAVSVAATGAGEPRSGAVAALVDGALIVCVDGDRPGSGSQSACVSGAGVPSAMARSSANAWLRSRGWQDPVAPASAAPVAAVLTLAEESIAPGRTRSSWWAVPPRPGPPVR